MSITLKLFGSKSELLEHLRTARTRTVLIGADVAEAPRDVYSVMWMTSAGAPIEIGLVTDSVAPRPALHALAGGKILLVGYDTHVAGVEIATAAVRFQIELWSPFFEFFRGPSDDSAIVVHEIGATMVDAEGAKRWSVSTDILDEWYDDGAGGLWLRNLYGKQERMRVDIVTGELSA